MKLFVYIKDGKISLISEEIIQKKTDSQDGMIYDEVMETDLVPPFAIKDGKIIEERKKTKQEKKTEIINSVDLSQISLDSHIFTDIEIGEIITERVFGGNPYAQQVLQAKVIEVLMQWIAGNITPEGQKVLEKADIVKQEINKVREFFGLSKL